jgi:hypothetical protein
MTSNRYNVEKVTRSGSALYLAYDPDFGKTFWSPDAESALEYDDIDEAQADAETHGGEVLSFGRPGDALAPAFTLIAAE